MHIAYSLGSPASAALVRKDRARKCRSLRQCGEGSYGRVRPAGMETMPHELLNPDEMAEADRLAAEAGPFAGIDLMRRAGAAVAEAVLERFPEAAAVHVLCGPGNNGGDGYVVARLLDEAGVAVNVWSLAPPKTGTDAAIAAGECPVPPRPLQEFHADAGDLVVDALFGAGLSKPVAGATAKAIAEIER